MKINIKNLFLGSLILMSIFFAACKQESEDTSKSENTEETKDSDEITTISVPSLVSRDVYLNVYLPDDEIIETEHWYYDSTNKLKNYTAQTFTNLTAGYQEVVYVFSDDPKFAKTGKGEDVMYDTAKFITTNKPEENKLYVGKYIYTFDEDNNCTSGAYIEKGAAAGATGGCFKAVYGDYGYILFKEASEGTISGDVASGFAITPTAAKVTEFRLCSYDETIGDYLKEAYYSAIPTGWTYEDDSVTNTNVAEFIASSSSTTPDSKLITKYSCKYDDNDVPLLEVKWEKRSYADAPANSSGSFEDKATDSDTGALTSAATAATENISKIVYEFDTIKAGSSYKISLQKSYKYNGTASIPDADTVKTDGSDYSEDGELAVISRQFEAGTFRKKKETETSYGKKIKTIVWQYDADTTDEYGLASETTYDGKDLLLSSVDYALIDSTRFNEPGSVSETVAADTLKEGTTGDVDKFENKYYEYSTSRAVKGVFSPWGLTMKRPVTIHWSER